MSFLFYRQSCLIYSKVPFIFILPWSRFSCTTKRRASTIKNLSVYVSKSLSALHNPIVSRERNFRHKRASSAFFYTTPHYDTLHCPALHCTLSLFVVDVNQCSDTAPLKCFIVCNYSIWTMNVFHRTLPTYAPLFNPLFCTFGLINPTSSTNPRIQILKREGRATFACEHRFLLTINIAF